MNAKVVALARHYRGLAGSGVHLDSSLGQNDRSTAKRMTMCRPIRLSIDARAGAVVTQPVIRGMMAQLRLQDRSRASTMDDAALMRTSSVAKHLLNACPKPRHAASHWLI
ncbi:hypothetical protein [Acidocella sp. MX-AZ02]|uniref:hypothetical protein n=1 Tax=Acidocella sp. MX-AZ02 TaxID=1214225 RepID=UPI001969C145|nr:hypothetical protein [Acidocella sp. MX-AZ02]